LAAINTKVLILHLYNLIRLTVWTNHYHYLSITGITSQCVRQIFPPAIHRKFGHIPNKRWDLLRVLSKCHTDHEVTSFWAASAMFWLTSFGTNILKVDPWLSLDVKLTFTPSFSANLCVIYSPSPVPPV
jgi:hypothetical protein